MQRDAVRDRPRHPAVHNTEVDPPATAAAVSPTAAIPSFSAAVISKADCHVGARGHDNRCRGPTAHGAADPCAIKDVSQYSAPYPTKVTTTNIAKAGHLYCI